MYLLGIDVETTGLDPSQHHVIELAGALYNTETRRVTSCFSFLLKHEDMVITPEITALTGIHACDVLEFGVQHSTAWAHIAKMAGKAEAWVAHNAEFERGFIPESHGIFSLPCLDTMKDVPYPSQIRHRDLERLSLSHGCPNMIAHQALPDVLTMFEVLSRYDWDEVQTYWQTPAHEFQALCTFENKDHAKALGFNWDGKRRIWVAELRQREQKTITEKIKKEGLPVELVILP